MLKPIFLLILFCLLFGSFNSWASSQCEVHLSIPQQSLELDWRDAKKKIFNFRSLDKETRQALQAIESQAITVVDHMIHRGKDVEDEIASWALQVEERQKKGLHITPAEHTALQYILKIKFFENYLPEHNLESRLRAVLQTSWWQLAKVQKQLDEVVSPLPIRLYPKMTRRARAFHMAAFPEKLKKESWSPLKDVIKVSGLGLAALSLKTLGLEITSSAIIGYLIVLFVEYYTHKYVGHKPAETKAFHAKLGRFGSHLRKFSVRAGNAIHWTNKFVFKRASLIHQDLHHQMTFGESKSYIDQFISPEHKKWVDDFLKSLGPHGEKIIKSSYGEKLTLDGTLLFIFQLLPFQVAVATVVGADMFEFLTIWAAGLLYPFNAAYAHSFLHKTRERALSEAPWLMRKYLNSWLVDINANAHHRHHYGGGSYALNFGSDALFDTLNFVDMKGFLAMRRLQIIGAWWDDDAHMNNANLEQNRNALDEAEASENYQYKSLDPQLERRLKHLGQAYRKYLENE